MALVYLAVAWLSGIAAVALWDVPWWLPGLLLVLVAVGFITARREPAAVLLAVCGLLALVGAFRFIAWRDADPPSLVRYVGQNLTLDGTIDSEPDPGESWTSYLVRVDRVETSDGRVDTVDGRVRVRTGQYAEHLPGEQVRLKGALKEPPVYPDFDYRSYLARHGVVATMSNPLIETLDDPPATDLAAFVTRLRLRLDRGLQRSLPEPEASLGAGIAFGRDGNIPDALYNDFRDTGLAHIVAVSGSNVSIVAALTFLVFIRLIGRRWAILPAALTVAAYLFVAGLSASVVRAGIMAGVFLLGQFLGRQQSGLAALGVAAIGMTAVQPGAALDLGFQLSLAATAGLIAFGPWIRYALDLGTRRLRIERFVPSLVVQVVALSVSATIATLPIVWVNFGRVSLIGPLANIVIEPLFVFAFWLSAVSAVAGAVSPTLGWLAGFGAYFPLALITWFARNAARLPFAAIDVPRAHGTTALLAYVALGAAGLVAYRQRAPILPEAAGRRITPKRRLVLAGAGVAMAGVALVPISLLPLLGSDGQLSMMVLDSGAGDAILFTTPHGDRVLVNAGPSGVQTTRELGAVLPHWERSIDVLVITQPQDEHAGGAAEVLRRFDVRRVIDAGLSGGKADVDEYISDAGTRETIRGGQDFKIDGVTFDALWPPPGFDATSDNDEALVLRVTYRGVRFLLPSNVGAKSQAQLGDVAADVLVVPHHGSNVTDEPFLRDVHPVFAVVPAGTGPFAQRPKSEVLGSLAGAQVFRTDRQGRVTIWTDGDRIGYETAR